jgi:uncharacterized membrane protein YbhN (UPF0104 family)
MKKLWKQVWPWLVGTAIVVVLAIRVPFAAFGEAVHQGGHLQLAAIDMLVLLVILATDTFATWVSLIAVRLRWPMRDVLAVRGATYVLALLNYVIGQGGVAYYLRKAGLSTLRATGVTLFMMGTTFVGLLLTTTATWMCNPLANSAMWWTLVISCAAFALYLVVIAIAPDFLARRELFAPLFAAGLRGHATTIVFRLPHVAIIVLGHWLAMIAWGITVPFWFAATTLPVVALVTVLPISPAGLGTTQAALVYFFSDYAAGATDEARAGSVLAFAIVHFVYATLAQLVVGLACVPFARHVQPTRPSAEG